MYIYHAVISALSSYMIHMNLNTTFYTHVRRAQSSKNNLHKVLYRKTNKHTHYTHTHTHARTHTHAHTHTHTHTHTHARTHAHTHARTHARTHTHTHKQKKEQPRSDGLSEHHFPAPFSSLCHTIIGYTTAAVIALQKVWELIILSLSMALPLFIYICCTCSTI